MNWLTFTATKKETGKKRRTNLIKINLKREQRHTWIPKIATPCWNVKKHRGMALNKVEEQLDAVLMTFGYTIGQKTLFYFHYWRNWLQCINLASHYPAFQVGSCWHPWAFHTLKDSLIHGFLVCTIVARSPFARLLCNWNFSNFQPVETEGSEYFLAW